jgi:hypothetical protein
VVWSWRSAREINAYVANTPSPALSSIAKQYEGLVTGMAKPAEWNVQRKQMRQMDSMGFVGGSRY